MSESDIVLTFIITGEGAKSNDEFPQRRVPQAPRIGDTVAANNSPYTRYKVIDVDWTWQYWDKLGFTQTYCTLKIELIENAG